MPLFLDSKTKTPVSDKNIKDFILLTGDYQIPVYRHFPQDFRTVTFNSFQELEKIPCCSLLIRIRKAAKDKSGKNMTLGEVELEKAVELGIIDTPKPYSDGGYNNFFNPITYTESIVFEVKVRRHSPTHRDLVTALNLGKSGEEIKMTDEDVKNY